MNRQQIACAYAGVLVVSHITGREPDMGRVFRWIERGIEVEVR
ncbi:hypothetical protein O4O02_09020 [Pseudomonas fortuita]